MTYDISTTIIATQTHEPVMLDGEELKIGDEVIIARQPAAPDNDALWTSHMTNFVGCRGVVDHHSDNPAADTRNFGDRVVCIAIAGNERWWFRVSELERVHTYHQAAQVPLDTPTEFPNLVHTNETTGPSPLHPMCRSHPYTPYNPAFTTNERRLCPCDDFYGILSIQPGYDAYLTQLEFDNAQKARRERFYEWRNEREYQRDRLLRRIHKQLTTHPFAGTKKGGIIWRACSAFDRGYYLQSFEQQNRDGRAAAKIIGRLVGHFHPTPNKQRPTTDDEVFALLRSTLAHNVQFKARDALEARTDRTGAAYRAFEAARRKIHKTGEWQRTPWEMQAWFISNDAANNRLPHISVVNPQEVAYYQSVDKLIRGIETRTKPGRFLAKFFPNLTPDQVRQYANDYLVATAPKRLHIARTRDEIIMAINEGPGESCQSRHYYDGRSRWYRGHIHPAAAYASGDFEVLYITDDNKPGDPARLAAETQRITARVICNAKDKLAARIYGDYAKLTPLLDDAGYEQKTGALAGCHLLRIYDEGGSGSYIMPYVDAGIGSGGGCLSVDEAYDHDNGRDVWVLSESGEYSTYAGYGNNGLLSADDEERYTCERCGETHDSEDDIHYSEYEGTGYCSSCDDDFVFAVTGRNRYGSNNYDMVLQDNAVALGGEWYVDDDDLLRQCGFVKCVHCDEWAEIDDTTTTDSGKVCCEHQVVELAEESPEGNDYGYRPDCEQYVDVETGETVWLNDGTDADDFTTDDDTPKYVSLDAWREMQQRQESFEFVGPPKHNPVPYSAAVEMPLERITRPYEDHLTI